MAVNEILLLGNPLLRERCSEVTDFASLPSLAKDMEDTLLDCRRRTGYGRAMAAPQIGVMKRVVFLHLGEPWMLVNPEIVWRSKETRIVWDACLSFLFLFLQVERHQEVLVRYQDMEGKYHEVLAGEENDLAELLQHEIDHLDGILAIDRAADLKSLCSREEFEKRHRDQSPYASREALQA